MADFIEVTNGTYDVPAKGNLGVVFHIPGHCAGCKRTIESLKKRPCDGWNFVLVDAEADANKPLVERHAVQTAPTVVLYQNGVEIEKLVGLKEFLASADVFFGEISH